MTLKNSKTEYGSVTKSFHWVTAVLVIGLLAVGLSMDLLPNGTTKIEVYNLHKSFGITVLALMVCRACWHLISKKPGLLETLKPWEKKLAVVIHYLLYVLLVLMPITGWMFSSAAGRPVRVFGLAVLPDLVPPDLSPDKPLAKIFKELHGDIGTIIMIILGLHIAAALKHHFIDKDATLKRMLPCLLAGFLMIASPALAAAPTWHWGVINNHGESSLTFTSKQLGKNFTGSFSRFASYITFNPDDLASSSVKVDVDISSVHTGTPDRDELIQNKDWFDLKTFPYAKFESTAFRQTGPESYEADANLTIKDIALPVTLPFTLHIVKGDSGKGTTATMDGSIVLDRSKFNLGTGSQWADTGIIANQVPVAVHLVARLAGT